jgi:hypothetical protein
MITLLDRFWKDHPPVYVGGTETQFVGSTTIPRTSQKSWIESYSNALNYLKIEGVESFYLCLDDLHPIAECDEEMLNTFLPEQLLKRDAGYIYCFGYRGTTTVLTKAPTDGLLPITPMANYSIGLQIGLWNTDYAVQITNTFLSKGLRSIWQYEIEGSFNDDIFTKQNYIVENRTLCSSIHRIENIIGTRYNRYISYTPYPYVRGGYLYQGRCLKHIKDIYMKLVSSDPEVDAMHKIAGSLGYRLKEFKKRISRRLK